MQEFEAHELSCLKLKRAREAHWQSFVSGQEEVVYRMLAIPTEHRHLNEVPLANWKCLIRYYEKR